MNNERVGSSDYQMTLERKRHYHIWHKGVPNFHIWHKRVPRIIYHSKISLRLRHNVPQACDGTFCSRGTEIRHAADWLKDQMILPSHYS